MNALPTWRQNARPGISLQAAMTTHQGSDRPVAEALPTMRPELARILVPEAQRRWRGTLLAWYTPQRVEYILRAAMMGDLITQWELFHMMEQTWPRLAKNLGELKRAVCAMDWEVKAWEEKEEKANTDADEKSALLCHCITKMRPDVEAGERGFRGMVHDILDAWAKGISINEILWEQRSDAKHGDFIAPKATAWVHPDFYALDGEGRLGIRYSSTQDMGNIVMPTLPVTVEPFPAYKFLKAMSPANSFHFSAAALLRPLAWWWVASNFGGEYLVNYAQLFGLPIRWATYPKGAGADLIDNTVAMLENMGSAAYAAFPEGTQLNLIEGIKGGVGSLPQEAVLDRADKLCDLLILGQTLTTDVGNSGSRALGDVHKSVRDEIIQSAADFVSEVINDQLIPAVLELNYGNTENAPTIEAQPRRAEKSAAEKLQDQQRLQVFAAMAPIPKGWLYEHAEIPQPSEGEETVGGAPAVNPAQQHPEPDEDDKGGPSDGDDDNAQASSTGNPAGRAEERITGIVEAAIAQSVGARRRWLEPVRDLMDPLIEMAATNSITDEALVKFAEDAAKRVPLLFHKMDHRALSKSLEAAQATAMQVGLKDKAREQRKAVA